jgi:predicted transcriptional regulator
MKAIIDIAPRGSIFVVAREQIRTSAAKRAATDYHLSFESARTLFSELTPARIDLLEALRRTGPCSVYALAKSVQRNYSNIHTDIAKLEQHGLVERTQDDAIFVPFEAVEIRLELFKKAA